MEDEIKKIIEDCFGLMASGLPTKVCAKLISDAIVIDEEKVLEVLIEERLGFSEDYTCELAETIAEAKPFTVRVDE